MILIGRIGVAANRRSGFAYVSYVPDAIREYGEISDFKAIVHDWIRDGAYWNAGDIPRLLFLLQNVRQVLSEGVEGDFAELGVNKGHSARTLANAMSRNGPGRRLYLFDTFSGFDARDLRGVDEDMPRIYADTSLEAVRKFVGHVDRCDYRPGYFPESAAGISNDTKFALVHLDCDLYEPMSAALAFFYPRLSPGALMVIHDYSSGHWPGVSQAVDEFIGDKPERLLLLPDKSGTAAFRKL